MEKNKVASYRDIVSNYESSRELYRLGVNTPDTLFQWDGEEEELFERDNGPLGCIPAYTDFELDNLLPLQIQDSGKWNGKLQTLNVWRRNDGLYFVSYSSTMVMSQEHSDDDFIVSITDYSLVEAKIGLLIYLIKNNIIKI